MTSRECNDCVQMDCRAYLGGYGGWILGVREYGAKVNASFVR